MQIKKELLQGNLQLGFDPEYLSAFEAKVFYDGPQNTRRLINFFILLLLSTVIATYGVLSGSSATVIGAMIVAPLMGPIIATTAAVVIGSSRRTLYSLALTFVGVTVVILLSYFLSLIVPDVTVSFTENPEIVSRISPGLFALLTALGAGAAGAFITARAEIADSMGGVAIAISLVPPLCVVGISLSKGEWSAAGGAMLLFLTNFLAILLAGGLIFLIVGLGRVAVTKMEQHNRKRAFTLIVLGTLLIAIPLSLTAFQAITNRLDTQIAESKINEWLKGSSAHLISVNINGNTVLASVESVDEIPPVDILGEELAVALNRPVKVTMRVIPVDVLVYPHQEN